MKPRDPLLLGLALLFPMAVVTAAAGIPARRAMCVDPVVALRSE